MLQVVNLSGGGNCSMSVRKKTFLGIFLAGINFFGFLAMSNIISSVFILPAILIPAGIGLFLLTLRCPDCGQRYSKRKTKLFGIEVNYWGGFIPRHCSHCGKEL
jgi:hypothetical protein